MFLRKRGSSQAKLKAAYQAHRRSLRALARELGVPDDAVEELIADILLASLLQKPNVDRTKFLAGALTSSVKRWKERGR